MWGEILGILWPTRLLVFTRTQGSDFPPAPGPKGRVCLTDLGGKVELSEPIPALCSPFCRSKCCNVFKRFIRYFV